MSAMTECSHGYMSDCPDCEAATYVTRLRAVLEAAKAVCFAPESSASRDFCGYCDWLIVASPSEMHPCEPTCPGRRLREAIAACE